MTSGTTNGSTRSGSQNDRREAAEGVLTRPRNRRPLGAPTRLERGGARGEAGLAATIAGRRGAVAFSGWARGRMASGRLLARRTLRRAGPAGALCVVLLSGLLGQLAAAGFGTVPTAHAQGTAVSHSPNTLARFRASGNASGQSPAAKGAPAVPLKPTRGPHDAVAKTPDQMGPAAGAPPAHPVAIPLGAGLLAATGTKPGEIADTLFTRSSEGTLELGIAPHSIDVSRAGGTAPYTLQLTQTQGGFRGDVTQMAQLSLQVVDSTGHAASNVRLLRPLTLRLHYAPHELDGLNSDSLRLAWAETGNASAHVAAVTMPLTVDTKTRTMTAQIADLYSGPLVVTGDTSDANIASSEHVTSMGNDGSTNLTIPLDVPPAPQTMAPALQLVYSSATSNQRYNSTSPASWVGEGWNLSLGSITYDSSQNLFYLNDVGGFSEALLCCMTDSLGSHLFVLHHDPAVRVFTSNNSTNPNTENSTASCFHVLTPDGTRYDLGCTNDSRRTIVSGSSLMAIEWDVNHVQTAAGANSYDVSYWQDTATSNGLTYTRDANPAQILYNYNGGTAHARVLFDIHWPEASATYPGGTATATTYGTNYNCASAPKFGNTTLRCDDPITPSGWEPAPLTMGTMTLDSIWMQVYDGSAYQTVREYSLSYNADQPYAQAWDQFNGASLANAGTHTLAAVQEIPYQGGAAKPSMHPMVFGYTFPLKDEYHDYTQLVAYNNNQPFDQQNWRPYLNFVGDRQTGTNESIWYATAYGNTHGGPGGSLNTNPLACDNTSCNEDDDRQWPQQVVTQIRDNANGDVTTYGYTLNVPCPNNGCTEDTWIPPNSWNACGDQGLPPTNPNQACLMGGFRTYYDAVPTGFSTVAVTEPDGTRNVTQYYAGGGWGTNDWDDGNRLMTKPVASYVYLSGASNPTTETVYQEYSNNTADCLVIAPAPNDQLYQNPYMLCMVNLVKDYTQDWEGLPSTANVPLYLHKWGYNEFSTPANNSSTGQYYNHFYDQLLTTGVQINNSTADGFTASGSPYLVVTTAHTYVWDDQAGASANPGPYIVDTAGQTTLTDDTGHQWTCSQTSYDGATQTLNAQNTNMRRAWPTRTDTYASGACNDSGSDIVTGTGYDAFGQVAATTDADAIAGNTAHAQCAPTAQPTVSYPASGTGQHYSTCSDYGAGSGYNVYVTKAWNALNQPVTSAWDVVQGVETSATDLNGNTTSFSGPVYDYSGSPSLSTYLDTYTQTTQPLETAGWSSRTYVYSFCAQSTSGDVPCLESDTVSQLDGGGTNLLVTRKMYDREGRLVETRTSGPTAGEDTVTYTAYDDVHDKVFSGLPCTVASLSGSNGRPVTGDYDAPVLNSAGTGTSAYVDPTNAASGTCYNVTGTTTYNDGTGRVVATDDPLGTGTGSSGTGCLVGGAHHTTCTSYAAVVASSVAGLPSSDGAPYLQVVSIDANLHQSAVYKDALGRTAYAQELSGASQTPLGSGITSYAVTSYQYDPMGHTRTITDAQGNVTRYTDDAAGRETGLVDPDRGTWAYSYDANGNPTAAQDTQDTAYTTYTGYDGLNRTLWQSTQSNGSSPYAQWSYDAGTNGIGHVSGEQFNQSGTVGKGSYSYGYDARGRTTQTTIALDGTAYQPFGYGYNDANQQTSLTYPDGTVLAYNYNTAGKLDSAAVTLPGQSQQTTLASGISYAGSAGASGDVTGATVGGGMYTYAASYDGDLRLLGSSMTLTSSGATLFSSTRGYDGAGNVTSVATTLGTGTTTSTDNQSFCYDEQNRLVWATSLTATGPGGCASNTAGSLTAAGYTQPFSYDTLDRLTSNDVGSYSYGPGLQAGTNPAPLHAAQTVTGRNYTASYDAAGNMTCRAPNSTLTCAAGQTATGQQLGYDAAGRLTSWQDGTESPPNVAVQYAYDGEGSRVAQHVVSFGSAWTTAYLLGDTAETTEGSGTFTDYLAVPGVGTAVETNSPASPALSYLATDGLNSVSVALDALGNVAGQALYFPYGPGRYVSGRFPTTHGFTGQDQDGNTTGLFYDHARYYDPAISQFAQADTLDTAHTAGSAGSAGGVDANDGLNHFAYVQDNPETHTDPTGHMQDPNDGGGGGSSPPPPPGPQPPRTNWTNYRRQIGRHRKDDWFVWVAKFGPYVFNLNPRADNGELWDAGVLSNYFGVTMWAIPESRKNHTPDLVAGVTYCAFNRCTQSYQTPVELYAPDSTTDISRIREEVRLKGREQAPIVVVDISNNVNFQNMTPSQLQAEANKMIAWGQEGVVRVIFIQNLQVVADADPIKFGPTPTPTQIPASSAPNPYTQNWD